MGIRPTIFVRKLVVSVVDDPVGLPSPSSITWKEDATFLDLVLASDVWPIWSLMRPEGIFKDTHPKSLVLVNLEFLDLCVFFREVLSIDIVSSIRLIVVFTFLFLVVSLLLCFIVRYLWVHKCRWSFFYNLIVGDVISVFHFILSFRLWQIPVQIWDPTHNVLRSRDINIFDFVNQVVPVNRSHPLKDNALLKQQLSNCHSNSGKEGTVLSCDAPHSSDNNVSERDEQGRDHCKECEEHCVKSQQCVSITLPVQTVFDEVVLELKHIACEAHQCLDQLEVSDIRVLWSFEFSIIKLVVENEKNDAQRSKQNQLHKCFLVDNAVARNQKEGYRVSWIFQSKDIKHELPSVYKRTNLWHESLKALWHVDQRKTWKWLASSWVNLSWFRFIMLRLSILVNIDIIWVI